MTLVDNKYRYLTIPTEIMNNLSPTPNIWSMISLNIVSLPAIFGPTALAVILTQANIIGSNEFVFFLKQSK